MVADRLGIVPQQLNNKFNNSRLALSDLDKWLHCIGYELHIDFVPIEQNKKQYDCIIQKKYGYYYEIIIFTIDFYY